MRGMKPAAMATDGGTVEIDELLTHATWVRELAWRLVRDDGVADEIVQDTWLAALSHPPRSGRPVRPWLRTLLANVARKRWRSERRRREREAIAAGREAAQAPSSPTGSELVAQIELQRQLTSEVLELREPYRTAILRRFYRGESAAQIARRTGTPAGTVRSQIDRGLDLLRARMQRRHGGDRRALHLGLFSLAGERPGPVLGALASALQGVLLVKESGKLVGVAGIVLVLLVVSIGGWRALEGGDGEPQAAPVEMSAASKTGEDDVQVPEASELPGSEAVRQPVAEPAPAVTVPAAVRSTRLVARVVDGSGLPLEGATLGRHQGDGRARPSASDGRVALELADGDLSQLREKQFAQVFVVACPGHATLFLRATPWQGEETDLGDVELATGGAISGRVVDESGGPLANVRLHATHSRLQGALGAARSRGPDLDPGAPSAVSAADGTFTLAGVPVGSARVWGAGGDGGWSFTDPIEVESQEQARDVELVLASLDRRDRIAGVVQDAEGEPLPGAWIRYQFPSSFTMTRSVTADDQGHFEIVLEAREPHDIRAEDPNIRLTTVISRGVEPGTLDLVLQLRESRWIDVRAWDREGAPLIEGLKARTESDLPLSYDPNGAQVSPDNGGLRVRVPGEEFRVVVTVPGYAEATQGPFHPESPPATLDFDLEALAGIGGRVVHGGEPVAGARVELHRATRPGEDISSMGFRLRMNPYPETSTLSDDEGHFRLTTEEEDDYLLMVVAESFARAEWGPVRVDPHIPVEGVEIEIVRGGSIGGRVIPPPGREAVGLLVSVSRGDGDVRFDRTDEEGSFRFDGLTPGGWNVAYRVREGKQSTRYMGSSDSWEPRWDCQVVDGSVTPYDIDLRYESLAAVSGRLQTDGQLAEGWTAKVVHLYAEDMIDPARPVALDSEGRFEARVAPGTYTVSLQSPAGDSGSIQLNRRVEIGEEGFTWDLDLETGGLRGTSGMGARALHLSISLPEDVRCSATLQPDDEGRFALTGIPAGPARLHRIQFRESVGHDSWTLLRELEIEPGTVLELELD